MSDQRWVGWVQLALVVALIFAGMRNADSAVFGVLVAALLPFSVVDAVSSYRKRDLAMFLRSAAAAVFAVVWFFLVAFFES